MKYSEKELDDLFEEAVKRYPVGTIFKVVHMPAEIREVISVKKYNGTFVHASDDKTHINFIINDMEKGASVFVDGKWAEIVSYSKNLNYEIF